MFDMLDDLEDAVAKLLASEPSGDDVERVTVLAERMEFARLRAVGAFDRSCAWASENFLNAGLALSSKTRCSRGHAMRSVRLARKLEALPEVAAAYGAGEITGEHVEEITHPYTPRRAAMIEAIETALVDFARDRTPLETRGLMQEVVERFENDGGAKGDKHQYELNQVTLSQTLGGRGILNGSLDAELADIVLTALDAEMEVLRTKAETRRSPELRAEALGSICRHYLAARGDSTARGRGQTHVSVVADIQKYGNDEPDLVSGIRAEFAHGGL